MSLVLLSLIACCGGSGLVPAPMAGSDLGSTPDMAAPDVADLAAPTASDLATAVADLAAPIADLAPPNIPDLAIPVDASTCVAGGMTHHQLVVDSITLPQDRSQFALDFNGDGRTDNQFANLVGALMSQKVEEPAFADEAIAAGNDLMLLDVMSGDPTFTNDACAATTWSTAVAHPSPDFSGSGSFTVDGAIAPTSFTGPLTAGAFWSAPLPQYQSPATTITVRIPLFGQTPLTLVGANVRWHYSAGKLVGGQLNGAIRAHDIDYVALPSMAAALNQQIQTHPGSARATNLLALFDNGGTPDGRFGSCSNGVTCKGTDGVCGVPNDGVIQTCEVARSGLVANLIAPDVQLFDNGVYRPSPANAMKDSWTVGFGFSAVAASF